MKYAIKIPICIFVKWNTEYGIEQVIGTNAKNQTKLIDFDYSYYAPDIKGHLMNIFLKL